MTTVITSACSCGEPVLIEIGRTDVCRSDGKRPHYAGSQNNQTQLRCRKCRGWLGDTCADAAFPQAAISKH